VASFRVFSSGAPNERITLIVVSRYMFWFTRCGTVYYSNETPDVRICSVLTRVGTAASSPTIQKQSGPVQR
jgi:hypothetical protein